MPDKKTSNEKVTVELVDGQWFEVDRNKRLTPRGQARDIFANGATRRGAGSALTFYPASQVKAVHVGAVPAMDIPSIGRSRSEG